MYVALQKGETAVHAAARHGHLAVLQFLAVHGQSLNPQNKSHETPLHLAAIEGHSAVVELLIVHNAKPVTRDVHGESPIMDAARYA